MIFPKQFCRNEFCTKPKPLVTFYKFFQTFTFTPKHLILSDIFPGELHGRSGAIQAALNLEIATDRINYLNVHLEGLNGQLPNLDLVNTAVRLCMAEQVPARLHGQVGPTWQELVTRAVIDKIYSTT